MQRVFAQCTASMVQLVPTTARSFLSYLLFVLLTSNGWGTRFVEAQECDCSEQVIVSFITGGEDAPEGRFPYACSLRTLSKDDHFCGGVLVDAQHVLTAAHCVDEELDGADPEPLVYVGLHKRDNSDDSAEEFGLSKKPIIHPGWNGRVEDGHDIAILKLNGKSKRVPISLPAPESEYRSGTIFLTVGFGDTDPGDKYLRNVPPEHATTDFTRKRLADTLQILRDLTFYSRTVCNRVQAYSGGIANNMFCAAAGTGDTAKGDSGGPVFIPHRFNDIETGKPQLDRLVGLTSFGIKDQNSSLPGVYTKVSSFRTWIDCVIEGGDADECTRPPRPDTVSGGGSKSEAPVLNTDEVIRAPMADRDPECLLSYGRRSNSLEDRLTTCLGGTAMSRPKCVFWNETGDVDCFYRGADSSVHRMMIKDSIVQGIENIGGSALGDVECVITGPRSASCFIVSEDRALWTRELRNGKWDEWYSLGGTLAEVPACVSHSEGRIDCVGRELNHSMYHKRYSPGDFDWRESRNIGGGAGEKPSILYFPTGSVAVYYEGWDRRAFTRRYEIEDETWSRFDTVDNEEWRTPLSIVRWSNRTFFFNRNKLNEAVYTVLDEDDPDNSFFRTRQTTIVNSPVSSELACVSTEDFKVDCFVLGIDRTLQHSGLKQIGGSWTTWKPIIGPFIEAPTCFAASKTQVRCYLRSYTLALVEVVYDVD